MSKGQVLSDNQMASYLRQAGFPEKVIPRMVAKLIVTGKRI